MIATYIKIETRTRNDHFYMRIEKLVFIFGILLPKLFMEKSFVLFLFSIMTDYVIGIVIEIVIYEKLMNDKYKIK